MERVQSSDIGQRTAEELAEQMWEKFIKYMLDQNWTKDRIEHSLEIKGMIIKMWAIRLAENPSWVPVRTVCLDGRREDGTMMGDIISISMDFLRVG